MAPWSPSGLLKKLKKCKPTNDMQMLTKLINYLKETRLEMKKVNWPTRKEAVRFTVMVIIVSLAISAVLGAFDYIFQALLTLFI